MPSRTHRFRLLPGVLTGLAAVLLPPLAGEGRAQAQETPPTFPSGVELITVDAVVLDHNGRPVPGLTRDDFVVKEDGRPQPIVSFEAFEVSAVPEEPEAVAPAVVASNAPRGTGRAFAIVLDDLSIAPTRITAARETAERLIERYVHDGDLVTVATTSGDAWWSARIPEGREDLKAVLARAQGRHVDVPTVDWMTDYEAFWIANYEDSTSATALTPGTSVTLPGRATGGGGAAPEPVPPGSIKERVKQRWERASWCVQPYCDARVRHRAVEMDRARRTRVRLTLACVRRALEALAPVRGRKSLLLLSDGFLEDFGSDERAVAAASREANTAIYFVDVRGLVAMPGWGDASSVGPPPDERERTAVGFEEANLESAGAEGLADDTGGFSVRNTNDLSGGVWKIAAESRVFYLLGFYPPAGRSPREWRKLRVEVKRPGLTVRARRGYTLRSEMVSLRPAAPGSKQTAVDPLVVRSLDSAHEETGIPLRAIAYVEEPRAGDVVHLLLAAEVDAAAVAAGGAGGARLEVGAQVAMRDRGLVFRQDAAMTLAGAGGESPAWREFTRDFEVPPGVAQVRLVVRDPASGAIGSVQERLEIPFPGELRVSTPVLTDRILAGASPGDRPQPALAAHRVFPGGGGLYCEYEVFGAARPGGAPARVTAGFQIRASDGTVVRGAPPTPITPDGSGRVVRLVGASLEGVAEGSYELVIDVQDERTGERVVRHEPFALEGPAGEPRASLTSSDRP
jgi:VWFA-related protein